MFLMKTNKQKASLPIYLDKKINTQHVIPLNLYQTWYTLDLPPKMKENVELLKKQNHEFRHYLYDDDMCRNFIKENFDADILYAFDKLKPGAYKADLWRYCILYKKGGIYLDIKYNVNPHFKLIYLTDNEYYVRDRPYVGMTGIYNALLISKPNNSILYKCIQTIVNYVKYNITGYSSLYITGPHLMSKFFTIEEIKSFPLSFNGDSIFLHNTPILSIYNTYRIEQSISPIKHYSQLWIEKDIYNYPVLTPIRSVDTHQEILLPFIILNWFPLQFKKENTIQVKPIPPYFKNTTHISGFIFEDTIWFLLYKCNKYFFAIFDTTMNLLRYSELVILNNPSILTVKKDSIVLNNNEYSMEYIKHLKWYTS
jgi:mannosyltransferase OCH1-like enzyme